MTGAETTQGFDEIFTIGQIIEIPDGEMPTFDMTADGYLRSPPKHDGAVGHYRIVKLSKNSIEVKPVRKRKKVHP
jgi:hypothetical protein